MKLSSYKELIVWQKSIKLVNLIYIICQELPKAEDYVLSSQIKRAAISIPSNIAEGYGRRNIKEYIHFLYIALASCFEVETQLIIMNQNFKTDITELNNLITEVIKMLYSLISNLKPISKNNTKP